MQRDSEYTVLVSWLRSASRKEADVAIKAMMTALAKVLSLRQSKPPRFGLEDDEARLLIRLRRELGGIALDDTDGFGLRDVLLEYLAELGDPFAKLSPRIEGELSPDEMRRAVFELILKLDDSDPAKGHLEKAFDEISAKCPDLPFFA